MAKKASNAKKAQPKSPVKRSTRRKRERTAIERKKRNYRVEAIIYAAAALISLFLIIIRGATVWSFFRGVFFGLLGVASILVPLTFAYLTVITALEKEIARFKTKVFMCIAIIFLAETAVYLICEHHFVEDNSIGYFADLGKLFGEAYSAGSYFATASGLMGGIFGYPILKAFGFAAALAVVLVVLTALILIIARISLIDVGKAAMYVGNKVSDVSRKQSERLRARRKRLDDEQDREEFEKFFGEIDIPIDDGRPVPPMTSSTQSTTSTSPKPRLPRSPRQRRKSRLPRKSQSVSRAASAQRLWRARARATATAIRLSDFSVSPTTTAWTASRKCAPTLRSLSLRSRASA